LTTIPARRLVQVNPGVLPAGGSALDMIAVMLTTSTRVPIGAVQQFGNPSDVGDFFGEGSQEKELAEIYFLGFDNSHRKPGSVLFAQYNQGTARAYIRSGNVAGYTLAELKAINGTLTIAMDGYPRSAAALNLSAATSFSSAAGIIQTALNAGGANPAVSVVTAAIAASTSSFDASINGNLMTVSLINSGVVRPGTTISGTGVTASTKITGQISGTTGGVGVYTVDTSQMVDLTTIAGTYGTMTVSGVTSGTISPGQQISGTGVTVGTQVTQNITGTGGTGTYAVDSNAVVASTTITGVGAPVAVTYDSTSGGFIITSGVYLGDASSAAYATGTTADDLKLQAAQSAVLSQGAAGQTPSAAMSAIIDVNADWATFMTLFDPDNGDGSTQKMEFAEWTNDQGNQYAYVAWDTDVTPTETVPAASSMGQLLNDGDFSGTFLQWAPDATIGPEKAAFICGTAASIDFRQRNGRITFAYRSQTGQFADVTNDSVGLNLGGDPQSEGSRGNHYNFYGAYATRNDRFVMEQRGFVSGPFLWFDSYINQIWLNNALQLSLMVLLKNAYSIPYNTAGYALIEAACLDPINAALFFGAIRPGITLSESQISQINNSAGADIADTVSQRGWYLQILDAAPQVRVARASPPMTLWYTDGQSVQAITLASIEVQ
jgi:hypothetical protein